MVIPPYDVISPEEQEDYYRTNPYNMVRLELGQAMPGDGEADNPHTRAAACLEEWCRDGVLVRDDSPAVYYYEMDYSLSPQTRLTRNGFICALRLEEFGAGSVLPHERTFQAIKDERLGLMLSCNANLSPVFSVYSDPEHKVDECLRTGREAGPIVSFEDRRGLTHRLWRVTDLESLRRVRELMSDRSIFIADGHHRYETALNYRSIQRKRFPRCEPPRFLRIHHDVSVQSEPGGFDHSADPPASPKPEWMGERAVSLSCAESVRGFPVRFRQRGGGGVACRTGRGRSAEGNAHRVLLSEGRGLLSSDSQEETR